MAKDNSFVEELQKNVEPGVVQDKDNIEELRKQLAELEADVIKDPKKIEALKKEIAKAEKAKETEKTEQEQSNKIKDEVEGASIAEIEEKVKAEKKSKDTGEQEPDKVDASTEKAYLDAMQQLHDYRIKMYGRMQIDKQLTATDKEFEKEVELEKRVVALETRYKAKLGDGEDTLRKKKEELNQSERKAQTPIRDEITRRSREYAKAVIGVYKVNQEIAYLHKLQRDDKISDEDYQKRIEIATDEQNRLKDRIVDLNPKELIGAMEIESDRLHQRQRTFGQDYLEEQYKNATTEEQESLKYQADIKEKNENNVEFAKKTADENLKDSIEEREDHIEKLVRKLDKLPERDIKGRMEILKGIEVEHVKLEHDQDIKDRKDRGVETTPQQERKENADIQEKVEETIEQNEKDYKETEEAIKTLDEIEGQKAVAQPIDAEEIEKESEAKGVVAGVVAAEVLGDKNDTFAENYLQGAVVKEYVSRNEFERQMHKQTVNIEDPEQAKAYVDYMEAQDELNKNQRQVERQIGA